MSKFFTTPKRLDCMTPSTVGYLTKIIVSPDSKNPEALWSNKIYCSLENAKNAFMQYMILQSKSAFCYVYDIHGNHLYCLVYDPKTKQIAETVADGDEIFSGYQSGCY